MFRMVLIFRLILTVLVVIPFPLLYLFHNTLEPVQVIGGLNCIFELSIYAFHITTLMRMKETNKINSAKIIVNHMIVD